MYYLPLNKSYGLLFQKNGEKLMEAVKGVQEEELLSIDRIKELLQTNSDEMVELVIHWLELKGFVHVARHDNTTLVKMTTNKNKSKEISEVDLAVFSLHKNEQTLSKNLEQLELEKQNIEQEARSYLRKGMRQVVSLF